jgi:ABC-2 type transport system ATP-binding protein
VDEGRTVVLSSHLLDEVEKVCDAIAIVDHGRVVVQGSIDDITGEQATTVLVGTNDRERTLALAGDHVAVAGLVSVDDGIRLTLRGGVANETAMEDLNRRLVEAGIGVHRLELERVSLEERFLQITTRLGESA